MFSIQISRIALTMSSSISSSSPGGKPLPPMLQARAGGGDPKQQAERCNPIPATQACKEEAQAHGSKT